MLHASENDFWYMRQILWNSVVTDFLLMFIVWQPSVDFIYCIVFILKIEINRHWNDMIVVLLSHASIYVDI